MESQPQNPDSGQILKTFAHAYVGPSSGVEKCKGV